MLEGWVIVLTTIIYVIILFAVARYGDTKKHQESGARGRPLLYALSLAIYCTTWTIFGSVGFAANNGINFIAIYLGPILIVTLGYPLLQKVLLLSKNQKITSVADFIGARYGKSAVVGGVAAIIAVIGTLPYIALQLKAISDSVSTLIAHYATGVQSAEPSIINTTLIIALVLAAFTILFGTRHTDATEHQHGMMLAVAMESVVKLLAFLIVGIFVTFFVFNGFGDLWTKASESGIIEQHLEKGFDEGNFVILLTLSALVFLLLPRQFHVMVVENKSFRELIRARWLFPLYLIAINIFVIPIALAGLILFKGSVPADNFVLALPISQESAFVSMMAFLGGLSAGTAMVIVACVALAIMVSNHIVLPLILRQKANYGLSEPQNMEQLILNIRRTTIFILLFAAYAYNQAADNSGGLVSIGLVSFAAIAQLAPAFFGGLFWRRANSRGALVGMMIGFTIWSYTLLLPTLLSSDHPLMQEGLFSIQWLRPEQLFYLGLSPLGNGVFFSLLLNTMGIVLGSLSRPSTGIELIQSTVFVQPKGKRISTDELANNNVTVRDLQETIEQYLGAQRTRRSFEAYQTRNNLTLSDTDKADTQLLQFSQQLLASAVGASTSRLVHSLLIKRLGHSSKLEMKLLDDASQALQYNRGVLQTALDQIDQGICVFDAEFRLSSWNRQFREMLNLPSSVGTAGTPFSTIIHEIVRNNQLFRFGFNEETITRNLIDTEKSWQLELPETGEIIDVGSALMPQGGLVLTWQDITDRVLSAKALSDANAMLEKRVAERTMELTTLNKRLEKATRIADQANRDKTRFIAAASHDIMQPLNAARLYSSTLSERLHDETDRDFAHSVNQSLDSVEDILGAVVAISHLDASQEKVKLNAVSVDRIFEQLKVEFSPIAERENLQLHFVRTSTYIRTDPSLFRRLLQNLISNALKYTPKGKVLVGCRSKGNQVSIEVLDTGIGIAAKDQIAIYKEFNRLPEGISTASGLGLGLSIVERISNRLGFDLDINSTPGKGTQFRIMAERWIGPIAEIRKPGRSGSSINNNVAGIKVLCVDNDPSVLAGLASLLNQWNCKVLSAASSNEAIEQIRKENFVPDIVLMDYHLDNETGIEAISKLRNLIGDGLSAVLVTAERSQSLRQRASDMGLNYISKPVKPAALRSILAVVRKVEEAAE